MRERKTLHITYGAMSVGISVVVMFLIHILNGFGLQLVGLPLIVYGLMFPLADAVVVLVSCTITGFMLFGLMPVAFAMPVYGLVSLAYVFCVKRQASWKKTYAVLYLAMTLVYGFMIAFFSDFFGLSLMDTVEQIALKLPEWSDLMVWVVAWAGVGLLILTEVFIIYTAGKIVQAKLKRNGK